MKIDLLQEYDYRLRQVIAEEVDVEISLRQRLASSIESRIAWAYTLQKTLAGDESGEPRGFKFLVCVRSSTFD